MNLQNGRSMNSHREGVRTSRALCRHYISSSICQHYMRDVLLMKDRDSISTYLGTLWRNMASVVVKALTWTRLRKQALPCNCPTSASPYRFETRLRPLRVKWFSLARHPGTRLQVLRTTYLPTQCFNDHHLLHFVPQLSETDDDDDVQWLQPKRNSRRCRHFL